MAIFEQKPFLRTKKDKRKFFIHELQDIDMLRIGYLKLHDGEWVYFAKPEDLETFNPDE